MDSGTDRSWRTDSAPTVWNKTGGELMDLKNLGMRGPAPQQKTQQTVEWGDVNGACRPIESMDSAKRRYTVSLRR